MFRRTSLITLIICVFSLFSYHNISYADNPDNVTTEATQLSNREDDVDRAEENYNTIKRAMETLISEWNDNRVKVEAGENVTVAGQSSVPVSLSPLGVHLPLQLLPLS